MPELTPVDRQILALLQGDFPICDRPYAVAAERLGIAEDELLQRLQSLLDLLPAETAQAYQVLPLAYDKTTNTLTVAIKSADNFRALDDLRLLAGTGAQGAVLRVDAPEGLELLDLIFHQGD